MRYVGSKSRHAKFIIEQILKPGRSDQWWVEPFVGGGNVICRVAGRRLGNDSNKYVVALLKAVQDGWVPPEHVTEQEYLNVKAQPECYDPAFVGFVGTQCTFGSKWFDCYARVGTKGPPRNFAREGRDNLLRQRDGLLGAVLKSGDYQSLEIPPRSILYCDPPYRDTLAYAGAPAFDSDKFWEWCDDRAGEGHGVFVSEYSAPEYWRCVWSREVAGFQSLSDRKRPVEKLFTCTPHYRAAEERITDAAYDGVG